MMRLREEIRKAKEKFGLAEEAGVRSCYEGSVSGWYGCDWSRSRSEG